MSRIAPAALASVISDLSWLDRLDLSSPSLNDRDRAALALAEAILRKLDAPESTGADDRNQLPLPLA